MSLKAPQSYGLWSLCLNPLSVNQSIPEWIQFDMRPALKHESWVTFVGSHGCLLLVSKLWELQEDHIWRASYRYEPDFAHRCRWIAEKIKPHGSAADTKTVKHQNLISPRRGVNRSTTSIPQNTGAPGKGKFFKTIPFGKNRVKMTQKIWSQALGGLTKVKKPLFYGAKAF